MNTFGRLLRLTTFGESHGPVIGGVLDGVPAGLEIDFEEIDNQLARRRPGQSTLSTPRQEVDRLHWLSGLFEGKTLGTPIAFVVYNEDARSADYDHLREVYRPGHADYVYEQKYGIRDHRGGGRASARETVTRVVAGSIARQLLWAQGIRLQAYTYSIGPLHLSPGSEYWPIERLSLAEENAVRCPNKPLAEEMIELIRQTRDEGNSLGGVIRLVIDGVPAGWGEPLYDKLPARLAYAMMSINAVKGVEIGEGFSLSSQRGSEVNDSMGLDSEGQPCHRSNHSGGILGGISNGERIWLSVAFKPTSSIPQEQCTLTREGRETSLCVQGRHDPCVVPRAVPIVEAMAALVLADHYLLSLSDRFSLLRTNG